MLEDDKNAYIIKWILLYIALAVTGGIGWALVLSEWDLL